MLKDLEFSKDLDTQFQCMTSKGLVMKINEVLKGIFAVVVEDVFPITFKVFFFIGKLNESVYAVHMANLQIQRFNHYVLPE